MKPEDNSTENKPTTKPIDNVVQPVPEEAKKPEPRQESLDQNDPAPVMSANSQANIDATKKKKIIILAFGIASVLTLGVVFALTLRGGDDGSNIGNNNPSSTSSQMQDGNNSEQNLETVNKGNGNKSNSTEASTSQSTDSSQSDGSNDSSTQNPDSQNTTDNSINTSSDDQNSDGQSSGGGSDSNDTSSSTTHTMSYSNNCYEPQNISIALGDKIMFNNESSRNMWPASDNHPSHTKYPEFDSNGAVSPGESYTFTFTQSGSWGYHDHLKPGCSGTITVN